jgi:S-methylmethionine-dependent homocysteine/selenocysteine methylase
MSTVDDMSKRLAAGAVVVLDGGMGTELEARGVPMNDGAWCAIANLEHYDTVRAAHEDYIRAGAEVIITNTFAAGRFALEAAGYRDRVEEANRRAVEAALEARERTGRESVVIAGSMSRFGLQWGDPPWSLSDPPRTQEEIAEAYGAQARFLAEAGADLIVLEMMDPGWLPAVQAAADTGLPIWLALAGVMLDEAGRPVRWPEGQRLEVELPALIDPSVTAVTVLHSDFDATRAALQVIPRFWSGPFGAYPHYGGWERPNWVFKDISPEQFATEMVRCVELGAQIVGGCCGIRPDHIRALSERVSPRVPTGTTLS